MKRILSMGLTLLLCSSFGLAVLAAGTTTQAAQPRKSDCPACGQRSAVTVKSETFETGPYEVDCIHYPYGSDETYHQNATYYQVCGSCGYQSGTWTVDEGESLRFCHGWSKTDH